MKKLTVIPEAVSLFCLGAAALLLVAFEFAAAEKLQKLKAGNAEIQTLTERVQRRTERLGHSAAAMENEEKALLSLPVHLASSAEDLKALAEKQAVDSGIQHSAVLSEVDQASGKAFLNLSVRASPEACRSYLKVLLNRRELFFVTALELRNLDDSRVRMDVRLLGFFSAAEKGERP